MMNSRTVVITDVHGCYEELVTLLKRIKFSKCRDRIIFLGDSMDRGKDSWECFNLMMTLKRVMGDNCILLMGDHDLMLKEVCGSEDDSLSTIYENISIWKSNGSESTVYSFEKNGKDWRDCVKEYDKYFKYYHKEGTLLFSHAGSSLRYPERFGAGLVWNRVVSKCVTKYDGLQIIGHSPLSNPIYIAPEEDNVCVLEYEKRRKLPKSGVINLDTGCVFGRSLTAMCIYYDGTYRLFKEDYHG